MIKELFLLRSVAAVAALTLCGAAVAAGQDSQTVAKDARTGKVRNATAAEAKQLNDLRAAQRAQQAVARKASGAPQAGVIRLQSNGIQAMHVDEESVSYSVVKRDASGKIAHECVTGHSALEHAMATPAMLPVKESTNELE